ncbi:MAG: 50S ribosomal protein L1 [Candidatus Algichlamydia australiensis]|nr:50S ribosomal protein L1 [Chlamydiales bacterium]
MAKLSKRFKEIVKSFEEDKEYTVDEAIAILQKTKAPKFDESVEVALRMGADPKKADQQVRGTVSLPHGTGKSVKLVVFAKGDKLKEAMDAGADLAGDAELMEKIQGGWLDFNAVIATPDMMREIGRLAKVLGPRGMMPTPKAGTVTTDVAKAVKEIKAGKIEYRLDKNGCINNSVGKRSFSKEQLVANILSYIDAIQKAKPVSTKGTYMMKCVLSTTMGPGLKIKLSSLGG